MAARPARPVGLFVTLWVLITALLVAQSSPERATAARNRAFVNGRVFDGQRFVAKPLYVTADGLFSRSRPSDAEVIDLAGGYVVPPFGEGHNHNLDSEAAINRYLRAGIFYVSNPNTHPGQHSKLPPRLNSSSGVDVQLAGGGLTGTGGHPFFVVQRNIDRKLWTEADGDGAFYHAIDSPGDVDRKWPAILAARPDFIKIYLLYSEEFARRRDDRAFIGWRGLDPALVPLIVQRARASGLRVAAHVETAADFRAAVRGGVDVVAHLPGFRPPLSERPFYPNLDAHRLTAVDAQEAAQRRVTVVTTVSDLLGATERGLRGFTPSDSEAFRALIRGNLSVLKAAGVSIALGSDNYEVTSEAEVRTIAALDLFSPLELLRMWSVVTPTMIFSRRRIARLEPGYEASFLVLDGDPTRNVENLFRVVTRVKQGVVLPGVPVAARTTAGLIPGLHAVDARAASAVFTRSGVNGTVRTRAPVASKIALPIAAATTVIDVSPVPQASSSG
jgi:Amidohydrolase family